MTTTKTTIRVEYNPPPIPCRDADWSAVTDDYEPGGPIGYGRTKVDAVADLIQQLEALAERGEAE